MLKVEGVETWYGAIQALKGISLQVKQGEIVALLGATPRKNPLKADVDRDLERVFHLFPVLKEFKDRLGWQLSGGQQQMLAIGRGLMSGAKLLLMDEPSLGLAPVLVQEVFKVIKEINRAGTTILLVEQNARMALLIAMRGYVLETGRLTLTDTAAGLLANEDMKAHYLGAHAHIKESRQRRRRLRPSA